MSSVETNTNQRLRKKYFVDADSILIRKKTAEMPEPEHLCRIIDAQAVNISKTTRRVGSGPDNGKSGRLNVQMIKEGDRIAQIRIDCPCGRHAELDCRYDPAAVPRPPSPARPPEQKAPA